MIICAKFVSGSTGILIMMETSLTSTVRGKTSHILFHETNTFAYTGAAQSLFNLLIELDRSKFEIRLISPGQSHFLKHARKAGILVKIWPQRTSGSRFLKILDSWLQTPALIRYFKREGIQLLHCNRLQSVLTFGWAAKLSGIPVIWHVRGDRSISISEIAGFLIADRVICISEAVHQKLIQSTWIHSKKKVITLHNGVNLTEFIPGRHVPTLRAELGINDKDIVITWIAGGINPSKRPELFIKMAMNVSNSFPDCRFLIVGEAPEDQTDFKNSLVKSAEDIVQNGKLIFTGFRNDVRDILAETNILVLTSSSESLPRAVLEAAATGCPVVGTEVSGIHELVINNVSGYIVAQNDLEGLIYYVSYLIKNPQLRLQMGRAGRAHIEQNFDSKKVARKYEQIVMDLLKINE